MVLLPTLGGQTALNTAMSLHRSGKLEELGIEMIGANADAIERGEDRQAFKDAMLRIGLDVPSRPWPIRWMRRWRSPSRLVRFH